MSRQRLTAWESVLAQCKLDVAESSGVWSWRARLTARSGPIEVWLSSPAGKGDRVLIEIEGPAGFSLLKLRRQHRKLWTREIEIGDKAFDDAFLVDGPLPSVCALLDETTRRLLVRASIFCDSLEMGDGRFRVETADEELPVLLPLLLDVSRRLAEPLDVKERIVRNARRDPRHDVRLNNLLLLIRESPGDPETRKTLQRACSDVSPKVRVRAAIELGDEARPVLLKIAEKSSDDAAIAQAVEHLDSKLTFESAKSILTRALRKGFPQTARVCLGVLGRRRGAAVGTLAHLMQTREGELAAAAALALGTTGEAAAVPPLLAALQNKDSDLREAAAAALGQVGSVEAVQPLKDAAERFWLDLGLRRAARQAIAEIQSRADGASPGQLSLADAEAGQLSLTGAEAGQLSLSPEKPPSPRERPAAGGD